MKNLIYLLISLFVFSCGTKDDSFYYSADCGYLHNDSLINGKVSLFLDGMDTVTVILPDQDPIMKVGSTERDPGKTIRVSGLAIDYSNPDSIIAYTIKKSMVIDTLITMDTVTQVESIMVVSNEVNDTLSNCLFKKIIGKYKNQ